MIIDACKHAGIDTDKIPKYREIFIGDLGLKYLDDNVDVIVLYKDLLHPILLQAMDISEYYTAIIKYDPGLGL